MSFGFGGTARSAASVAGVANSMLSAAPSVMAIRPKLFFQYTAMPFATVLRT